MSYVMSIFEKNLFIAHSPAPETTEQKMMRPSKRLNEEQTVIEVIKYEIVL